MAESAPQLYPSRESLRMIRSMGFAFTRAAACALVTVALVKPAAAEEDQGRPIKLLAGSSAAWNSNVFLVPNNVQSDFYFTPYVGLSIDKTYA